MYSHSLRLGEYVKVGDIEGTVHILNETADSKEAANVQLQLYSADGKLIRETQTSFDGYYLLNGVPAGDYTLRVSLAQAARLGFITPPDRSITITPQETDSQTLDLDIIRIPESESNQVQLPG